MPRHTAMPPRIQRTPHGDVTLTSRWMRDHYILRAYGPEAALRWMFPKVSHFEQVPQAARHSFEPTPDTKRVTVERELRHVCQLWQEKWNDWLQDHQENQLHQGAQHSLTHMPAAPALPTTLGSLLDQYTEQRRQDLSPRTHDRNQHYLALWKSALGASFPLSGITEERLRIERDRLAKRLKPSTVNSSMAVLKTYLNWAHAKGIMHQAPHRLIKPLKDTRSMRDIAWWTVADVDLALRCAEQDAHQPTATLLIALGCMVGLRYEEITMQRWEDIDLDAIHPKTGEAEPVLHVVPHDGWKPKNGEPRTIPVNRRLAEILRRHRQPTGHLLTPEPIANRTRPQRARKEQGKRTYRYDPKKVWNRIISRVIKAGGKRITPHGMRHSFASAHLICNVPEMKVARWLGHADTTMIHERYGHLLAYDRGIDAVCYPSDEG